MLLNITSPTNIAVMSELGRYPIYFSVILAMLKYCHRLEGQQEGLLFDAYICNKELKCFSSSISPLEQFVYFLSDLIMFLYLPVSIFNG
jgi:hypothetical protein